MKNTHHGRSGSTFTSDDNSTRVDTINKDSRAESIIVIEDSVGKEVRIRFDEMDEVLDMIRAAKRDIINRH